MKFASIEITNKKELALIDDLCPNERLKFEGWLFGLINTYSTVIGDVDVIHWYGEFMGGKDIYTAIREIKTPCIMTFNGDLLFYFDSTNYFNINASEYKACTIDSCDANVTTEYLNSTYGKVESPEHAEFIIELCKANGIAVKFIGDDTPLSFEVICGQIRFYSIPFDVFANNEESKQITIPIPPTKQGASVDDFNETAKKAPLTLSGDKDWPQVGDKVTWGAKVDCWELVSKDDACAWVKLEGRYQTVELKKLSKPKAEDEILRDELTRVMQRNLTYKQVVNDLMDKYNITKKPQ